MISPTDFALLLIAMGCASFACRAAGFIVMGYLPLTPRIEAALRATPIAVMTGIVVVTALRGGPAEWLATGATLLVMRLFGRDVVAAFAGVGVLALLRLSGI